MEPSGFLSYGNSGSQRLRGFEISDADRRIRPWGAGRPAPRYFRWQAVMAEAVAGIQAQPDQHPLRGIMQACSKE
jgi:hypothetical protein